MKSFNSGFLLGLICISVLLTFPFNIFSGHSLENTHTQPASEARRGQISKNIINTTIHVSLADNYELLNVDIYDPVIVNITTSLFEVPSGPYTIYAVIEFTLTEVANLPAGATYTYGFWGFPPVGLLSIRMPSNISESSITLKGHISGISLLWRSVAEIRFLNVTSSLPNIAFLHTIIINPPSAARVQKVYSHFRPDLQYYETSINGKKSLVISSVPSTSPVIILYEPYTWQIYAFILMLITIFMVYAIPQTLKSQKIRTATLRIRGFHLSKVFGVFKQLYAALRTADASKFLFAYIMCALLMISLSFTFGPDPRLKVYVLSSTPSNAQFISDYVHTAVGGVALTIYDEMNEFETLTSLGVFSAVIVGDFFSPTERMLKIFIYPALDLAPTIVVLKNYAYEEFSLEMQRRYSDKTVIVDDLPALGLFLYRLPRRTNALGLNMGPTLYLDAAAIVGLLSLGIVFLGTGFLASKLGDLGKKKGVLTFSEAIICGVAVFFFTQVIYIVCSVLLAMPLGLHTSISKVTAIGLIGFGGGTRPRMLFGLAGFLFGSFISLKKGFVLNKTGLAAFMIMAFFVLIDPLTSGIIFYEFVLLFTVGPTMEYAYVSESYLRSLVDSVARAFGAWISPVYAISIGVILYYAGITTFYTLPKLRKSTATFLLLLCAFLTAQGNLRVADMRPWKSVASIVPGIAIGFVLIVIFFLISYAEKIVRERIVPSSKFA